MIHDQKLLKYVQGCTCTRVVVRPVVFALLSSFSFSPVQHSCLPSQPSWLLWFHTGQLQGTTISIAAAMRRVADSSTTSLCPPLYTSICCLGFHIDQEQAIPSLIAAAIHRLIDSPAELLLIHPPAIPPIKIINTAPTLRFLFTLSAFNIFGSLAKSQYTLVKTVVGTSLNPSSLDVTICPPDWKARKPSGSNSMKFTVPLCVTTPCGSGATCACTRAAAMTIQIDWRRKDTPRVPRALGFMSRVFAKNRQPIRNQNMELRDLAQP